MSDTPKDDLVKRLREFLALFDDEVRDERITLDMICALREVVYRIDQLERDLADHRDNGRRLMESADAWKAEAESLRGIKRALEDAQRELAEVRRELALSSLSATGRSNGN